MYSNKKLYDTSNSHTQDNNIILTRSITDILDLGSVGLTSKGTCNLNRKCFIRICIRLIYFIHVYLQSYILPLKGLTTL